jgi:excisionase family DNA binding protein
MTDLNQIAYAAARAYAETHPRPPHVTQAQAAEMLNLSRATISRMVRAGTFRLNKAGLIPIAQIDEALEA